jgi:hypothetical protein
MRVAVLESKGRWVIAAAGAVAITGSVLLLFQLPGPVHPLPISPVSPAPATPKASVRMARPDDTNRLLKEEALLRDLRPLFLPTERNAALPEPRIESGRTFLENETIKFTFSDAEAQLSKDLPAVVTLNAKPVQDATPVDALSPREAGITLEGFGRRHVNVTAFAPRGGYIEVTSLQNGVEVLRERLSTEARPRGEKPWAPLEFVSVVEAAGLVRPLVVTNGSGVDEVDAHFKNFLAWNFRIGERLSPGFYRITVAP